MLSPAVCTEDGVREERVHLEHRTLEFVHTIEAVDDPAAVAAAFQTFVADFGFKTACCMKVPDHGESIRDAALIHSTPDGWNERYVARDYVLRDPMVTEMFRTYEPYSWSDVLERRDLSKLERTIVSEASEFAMNVGFVVPIFGNGGYAGMVSVTGEHSEVSEAIRASLQLASIYVHNRLLSLRRKFDGQRVRLTGRERECLRWVAAGKSDWDIGEILGISQKTVNFHIESAKNKLDVATRVQAVVTGIRMGLLSPQP
jgi:DNA-binding CsgD family transcriptional regulator